MKYCVTFLSVAAVLVFYAYTIGAWGWLLVWPALSFTLVACGYLGLGPQVFGKRADGTLAWYSLATLLPYLLYTWAIWQLSRLCRREDCFNEIVSGLYVGRRALAHELPAHIRVVVDMTAEFPEPEGVRTGRRYLCLPTLDASVPTLAAIRDLLETLTGISDPVYIHCAEGHGRSGTLAAALLLYKGLEDNVEDAIARLRECRPGIHLTEAQKGLVSRLLEDLDREKAS